MPSRFFRLFFFSIFLLAGGISEAEAQDQIKASCFREGNSGVIHLTQGGSSVKWSAVGFGSAWGDEKTSGANGKITFPDNNSNWVIVGIKVSGKWTYPDAFQNCSRVERGSIVNLPQSAKPLVEPQVDSNMWGVVIPRSFDVESGISLDFNQSQRKITLKMPDNLDSGLLAGAGRSRPTTGLDVGGPNGLYNRGRHLSEPVIVTESGDVIKGEFREGVYYFPEPGEVFNFAVLTKGGQEFEGWIPVELTSLSSRFEEQFIVYPGDGPSGMPFGFGKSIK